MEVNTLEREPSTASMSDQLRHCAEWLDNHDVRGSVLITASTDESLPKMNIRLDDMRRCFAGTTVKHRVAEYCTSYLLDSDGIAFQADEYGRAAFRTVESEVTL